MKTVYPVIATALSVFLLSSCLRYDSNLLVHTATDPSVAETASLEYHVANLPFIPPETTAEEETTEPATVLSETEPSQTEPNEPIAATPESRTEEAAAKQSYGSAGRIEIPSVGVGVPLNFARLEIDDVQRIVDAPDSAAYFWFKEVMPVIADHNNQGFANLNKVRKGDIAYASSADGRVGKYECTCVCQGSNTGTDILDNEGFSISRTINTSLIMYTCYDGWRNVLLTYWKAVD